MGYSLSRYEHIYLQAQPVGTYGTIPNTGGAAGVAATDAAKTRGPVTLNYNMARVNSPYKQDNESLATLDTTVAGRGSADYSLQLALASRSAIDVAPDIGPVLLAMAGRETINAATSVVYDIVRGANPLSFVLWKFCQEPAAGSTILQEVGFGCLVNSARLAFGQDFANLDVSGPMMWGFSNDQLAGAETWQKGGLTSWPSEPASQTYTGTPVLGRTGVITINGQTYTTQFRGGGCEWTFNRAYEMNVWNVNGPENPYEDIYLVRPTFTVDEEDTAAQVALRAAALARTPIDLSYAIGAVANGIYTFAFKNVILDYLPARSDGDRKRQMTFTGTAHDTNSSTLDQWKVTLT